MKWKLALILLGVLIMVCTLPPPQIILTETPTSTPPRPQISKITVKHSGKSFDVKPLDPSQLKNKLPPYADYAFRYGPLIVSHAETPPAQIYTKLKPGDKVTVTYEDGTTKEFQVKQFRYYMYDKNNMVSQQVKGQVEQGRPLPFPVKIPYREWYNKMARDSNTYNNIFLLHSLMNGQWNVGQKAIILEPYTALPAPVPHW